MLPYSPPFRQMMTEDFNDDGEKNINYKQIIYVPPEIADEYTENSLEFNEQINNEALRQYSATMQTGEYIICLIDESLYQQTRDNGLYLPLSDIFGSIPENAYDEYGFRLKDLPFGNSMSGVNSLSADTILCVRRPNVITSIWGGDSARGAIRLPFENFQKYGRISSAGGLIFDTFPIFKSPKRLT